MKICQLSHVEFTYNFLAPLFHALRADGHEVVAACTMDHGGRYLRAYLGSGYALHEVPGARRVTVRAMTIDILRLARYLRRERFDVLHVHSPLVALQARVAARIARVPVVIYHAHGFYFHEGMPALLYRAAYAVERFFCRHLTNYVVTINREDHDLARRERFRRDPRQVVWCPGVGIDPQRFAPPADAATIAAVARLRHDLGITDDALVVTFVGRLVGEKGIRELLTAFGSVAHDRPHLRLVVVGAAHQTERDQRTTRWIDQFLRQSAAGSQVLLLGRRNDVADILRASDIFVLPSYREGMPVSLLEAMASGLACITTDVRGCREAVDRGAGLLVPPRDVEALAHALRTLTDDGPLRARLGARARQQVTDRFATEHSVAPLRVLYRELQVRPRHARQYPSMNASQRPSATGWGST